MRIEQLYWHDGGAVVLKAVPGAHENTVGAGCDGDCRAVLGELAHSPLSQPSDGNGEWVKCVLPPTNMLGQGFSWISRGRGHGARERGRSQGYGDEQAQGEVHVMPNRVAVEQHSILECPENRLNNRSVGQFAWCNLPRQAPTVRRQPV